MWKRKKTDKGKKKRKEEGEEDEKREEKKGKKKGETTNDGNEGNVYTKRWNERAKSIYRGLNAGRGEGGRGCEVDKQVSKLVIELISSLIKEENPSWFFSLTYN